MILWVTINPEVQNFIVKPLQQLVWFLIYYLFKPLSVYQQLIKRFFVFMNLILLFDYHC